MVGINWIRSKVDNYFPKNPVEFSAKDEIESSSTLPQIIQKAVPEFYQDSYFYINPLMSSGHFQTAYTAINSFEHIDQVHYKRRILTVENKTYEVNGDKLKYDRWEGTSTIALDYVVPANSESDPDHEKYKPQSQIKDLPPRTEYLNPEKELDLIKDDKKPLLIALHGLSGGSYEAYLRAVLFKITSQPYDFDAVVLNSRGCAHHTITSPQLYNGLWTNDLRYLINEHIKPRWPNKRIYLIGFSLGGAILANYLGQESDNVYPMIKGAACLGTPWDFPDSAIHLRESLIGHNVYSPSMCQNLLNLLDQHYQNNGFLKHDSFVHDFKMNPANYQQVKYLRDFDDLFTSKLFGFNSADEYYRHASPIQRLLKVRVPLVILSSKDDPITGFRTLPINEVKLNPYTALITTTTGGHLGWFSFSGQRWYPEPIAKLFTELDKNWQVVKVEDERDLPVDINKAWKHDRLVYGMT
ncbi:Alpha/Beta hydrolase protein [Scheffersomyces amazonensis]|uniref:Alpha/Beta hydrolase protein n=1 Tax=Scheffersomyces amazonensis TaxID=1078765 RepID=UPI00315CA690